MYSTETYLRYSYQTHVKLSFDIWTMRKNA